MMVDAVNQSTEKFEIRVERVTRDTLMDVVKSFEINHHKWFIRDVFRCTNRYMMTTMLEDDGVREALKSAIIQMAASGSMEQAIAKMAVKDQYHLAPAA